MHFQIKNCQKWLFKAKFTANIAITHAATMLHFRCFLAVQMPFHKGTHNEKRCFCVFLFCKLLFVNELRKINTVELMPCHF
jgi:hypothetical protein